ncbi:unnamed protein product [Brassica napus]|uniref:(rape) hypothetical protein n=1 Tax=Brassica napus TaxID=3708 RepID=A0A816SD73_BRANA|nr:unnamed protein product [Brassica napus]
MNAWMPQTSYPCDVPPQPNSPPDNVLRSDRPTGRVLGLKEEGCYPPPIHTEVKLNRSSFPADSAKPVPLAVVSLDSRQDIGFPLSVPVLSWLFDARGKLPKEPFPVRPPADTRRSANRAKIRRFARKWTERREASTAARRRDRVLHTRSSGFSRAAGMHRTPRDAAVLFQPLDPTAEPQTNDLHVKIAAGLHQSFLWLRPASGIVHHLRSRQAC